MGEDLEARFAVGREVLEETELGFLRLWEEEVDVEVERRSREGRLYSCEGFWDFEGTSESA